MNSVNNILWLCLAAIRGKCSTTWRWLRIRSERMNLIWVLKKCPSEDTITMLISKWIEPDYHPCTSIIPWTPARFERIQMDQANELMLESSISRMRTFSTYKPPASEQDVRTMLGDATGGCYCVWRENGRTDEEVKTIAVGIFDLNAKTFSLYSDNPCLTEPHCTLPLLYK